MANESTTGFGLETCCYEIGEYPAIGGQSKYKIKTAPGVGIFKNGITSRFKW